MASTSADMTDESSKTTKTIVIFGATGPQGLESIRALVKYNTSRSPAYRILALTRHPTSMASQLLSVLPGVEIVRVGKKCMDEPQRVVFDGALKTMGLGKGDVWGVLSIQGYVDDKTKIAQGKAIANAAHEFGVKHIVYSSGEVGEADDTGIPSMETKRKVENHIKTLDGMGWTFLRPVHFMENFLPNSPYPLKVARTISLRYTFYKHPDRKHQLISCRNIGQAAAKAFVHGPGWCGGVVRLAGDELTTKDIEHIYQEVYGTSIPLALGLVAEAVKALHPLMAGLCQFLEEQGFNVDIEALRADLPELEDYRTFLNRHRDVNL